MNIPAFQRTWTVARTISFHLAFALFRFAIIFEGIAARAKAGAAAAANASEVGHLAVNFARRAVELIGSAPSRS